MENEKLEPIGEIKMAEPKRLEHCEWCYQFDEDEPNKLVLPVTEKVKEYAEYMKNNPSSLKNLPPIIAINGKLQDGAHRISALYLLQNNFVISYIFKQCQYLLLDLD